VVSESKGSLKRVFLCLICSLSYSSLCSCLMKALYVVVNHKRELNDLVLDKQTTFFHALFYTFRYRNRCEYTGT
jgi:hypothetical protein